MNNEMQEIAGQKRIARIESRLAKLNLDDQVIVGLRCREDYRYSMIEPLYGDFAEFVESLDCDAGWVREGNRTTLAEAFDEAWWVLDKYEEAMKKETKKTDPLPKKTWRTRGIINAEIFLMTRLTEEEAFAAHSMLQGHLYNIVDLMQDDEGNVPLTQDLHPAEDEFCDDCTGRQALRNKLINIDASRQIAFWTTVWASDHAFGL